MNAQVVLTPAESKRLIAKAVAALPCVKDALLKGKLAVAKGTTNSYLVEEILGKEIDKQRYVTGMRLPAKADQSWIPEGRLNDVVFHNGKLVEGAVITEYIKEMGRGDCLVKGANALEPGRKMAAIYVGHTTGGTIGATLGTVVARGIHLVIPIGLEKLIGGSITEVAAQFLTANYESGENVGYMPVFGEIVTEIEAFERLFAVTAIHTGSGGIGGAEGATHFLLAGDRESVSAAQEYVRSIQGEPAFAALKRWS